MQGFRTSHASMSGQVKYTSKIQWVKTSWYFDQQPSHAGVKRVRVWRTCLCACVSATCVRAFRCWLWPGSRWQEFRVRPVFINIMQIFNTANCRIYSANICEHNCPSSTMSIVQNLSWNTVQMQRKALISAKITRAKLMQAKEENYKKNYNIRCSQAVSDPSTNRTRRCLTWQIGRDAVCSTWYGRR